MQVRWFGKLLFGILVGSCVLFAARVAYVSELETPGTSLHPADQVRANDVNAEAPVENAPEPGVITEWQLSKAFPAGRLDIELVPYPRFYSIFGAEWRRITAEPSGLVNVAEHVGPDGEEPRCVMARVIVNAVEKHTVRLRLGYRDEVAVYLNGNKLFYGMSAHGRLDPSLLGAVDPGDVVFLQFEKGLNEIFLLVKEAASGWGFMARTDPPLEGVREDTTWLTAAWETSPEFLTPESVLYDSKRKVLYVSNFDNRARLDETDESKFTGYISKVGLDGKVLEKEWVKRLHAPCGMGIFKDRLYTLERRNLTEIDSRTGKILNRYPIPGCDFPNDLAIDKDGNVYISDTSPRDWAASKIYKFSGAKFEVWLDATEALRPNGMFIHNDRLLFGGNPGDPFLKSVDLRTKRVQRVTSLGAGVMDGIRVLEDGSYLVSHWEGQIYRVTPSGEVTRLMDVMGGFNTADFEYVPDMNMIVIPTFVDNRVVAMTLTK